MNIINYTIEDIRKRYSQGKYTCDIKVPAKVASNHVFDENLSVKKNREMAAEHNENVQRLQKEKMLKNNELNLQMRKDVVDYIVNSYLLNQKQAEIVESYVYTEKHAFMCDYFSAIDDFAEMVERVSEARD